MKILLQSAAALTALSMTGTAAVAADTTKKGYGQGNSVDSKNRPCGAVEFNSRYAGLGACALSSDENRIIITFDQGYENGYTAKILDTLRDKGVTAVFFLTGDYAKKESALVKRMIDEGHILGNHGMTHASLPSLSEAEAEKEIMSLHSDAALETVQRCGYSTVFWSYAYVDWKTDAQPAPEEAVKKLTESAHGGEILLLHSVSETNAAVLGEVIDRLREKGYTI